MESSHNGLKGGWGAIPSRLFITQGRQGRFHYIMNKSSHSFLSHSQKDLLTKRLKTEFMFIKYRFTLNPVFPI